MLFPVHPGVFCVGAASDVLLFIKYKVIYVRALYGRSCARGLDAVAYRYDYASTYV